MGFMTSESVGFDDLVPEDSDYFCCLHSYKGFLSSWCLLQALSTLLHVLSHQGLYCWCD